MRHMTFLRIYQPLEKLPERVQHLAEAAANLSRADIEAEAAERLNRRLRPDADSTVPSSAESPIIRTLERTDASGVVKKYFHVEYLARPAFESTTMYRKYYDETLYKRWVPEHKLDTLEKISELQADAGLISRPVSTFLMQVWTVPLQWLAIYGGPEEPGETNTVNHSVVDGSNVVRRIRDLRSANSRLGQLGILLNYYGPDGPKNPYLKNIDRLKGWLTRFEVIRHDGGLVELDYGALSKYAWPDEAGKLLEEGHQVLQRTYDIDDELEYEDPENYPGLPPAMLERAAETMRTKYQAAYKVSERIERYQNIN